MNPNPFDVSPLQRLEETEANKNRGNSDPDRKTDNKQCWIDRIEGKKLQRMIEGNTNAATVQENVADLQFGPEFEQIHGE